MDPNQNSQPINPETPAPAPSPEPSVIQQPDPSQVTAEQPAATPAPSATPSTPAAPTPTVSGPVVGGADTPGVVMPVTPTTGASSSGGSRKKPLLIALIALVVLAGGAAAYYFGYYTNSSVILSQSLSNTGKGYAKLTDYINQQDKLNNKGMVGSGSYTLKSGSTSTDGKLNFKSDGANSDLTFDIGLGVTRVNAEIMTIKSTGTNPDVYIKASGISGFGAITGSPEIDNTINQLDGKWIVIDHSLLDNITNKTQATAAKATPTNDEILDELTAFGNVNKQDVFTTNKSKSITEVVKKYGLETVDGHKTYHYKMGFNKNNLKQYITDQRDALNGSKLDAWIKANNYQDAVNNAYASLEKSADTVKSSDTFDLWADVNTRLVYKIRISDTTNPAENYADIGLNYKNGTDSYPFFLNVQSKDSSGTSTVSAVATLNTKDNSVAFTVGVKSSDTTFSANMNFKPSNQPLNLTAPAGAESLMQVLDQLGLGDFVNSYLQQAGGSTAAPNSPSGVNTLFQ